MNLTPREAAALRTYERLYVELDGICPKMDRVADEMSVTKTTVAEWLNALERKGYIVRDKHKARCVTILRPSPGGLLAWAAEAAKRLAESPSAQDRQHAQTFPVPLPLSRRGR